MGLCNVIAITKIGLDFTDSREFDFDEKRFQNAIDENPKFTFLAATVDSLLLRPVTWLQIDPFTRSTRLFA
mgnify:CR=1 FL=1